MKKNDKDIRFPGRCENVTNGSGEYAPPQGCILLAIYGEEVAGCVALRKLDEQLGEMKRNSL